MAIAEQLARADVNSRLGAADLIQPYSDLCRILADSDVQLALENCRKAMDAAGKIAASSPPAVANASLLFADVLRRLGRRGEAFDRLHLALGTFQTLFDQEPSRSYIAQALLRTHNQSGAFLLEIGDRQGALEHHRIAVSLASDLFRAQPANPIAHIDLANSYEAFAHAFEKQDWAQARELYGKSLDIWNAWPRQFKSGIDQQRRRRVLLAVARCDAALARR
jgi:tetratricopeptide (TPR) repeat protein